MLHTMLRNSVLKQKTLPSLALAGAVTAAFTFAQIPPSTAAEPAPRVVLASEVDWTPLNPARGDASPKAGTLWGDRASSGPSGFLVQFNEGFSSPPHIHNVTYRGVVIRGLMHNDDPKAADMWMPAGSFWTQPAGEPHITAAKGRINLAYIEIQEGPYLVHPTEQAFDNGERPVNVDKSNIVWLDASDLTWVDQSGAAATAEGPKVAFLWGKRQDGHLNGSLIKLPTGFTGTLRSRGATFRAVVIQGSAKHHGADVKTLEPGSYFGSDGASAHRITCDAAADCIIYARTQGKFDIVSAPSKK
jgi:hypothetical protein